MNKIRVFLVAVILCFGIQAQAATFESITVADTAIGITAAHIPSSVDNCRWWGDASAFCTLETAQIRFRLDGTNPTSAEGHLLNAGDILRLESCTEMFYFKGIRTGATSGVLKCTYQ